MSRGLSFMAALAVCALVAIPANAGVTKVVTGGGDIIWNDDFLRVGGAEFLDQLQADNYCLLGTIARPEYTAIDVLSAGGFNSASITVGNGVMGINQDEFDTFFGPVVIPFAILGWQNFTGPCIGGSNPGDKDAIFDHNDVCMYAGFKYNNWHLRFTPDNGPWGADVAPGYPGVDDDGDGTTDFGGIFVAVGRDSVPPLTPTDFTQNGSLPNELLVTGTYDGTITCGLFWPFVEEYNAIVTLDGAYGVWTALVSRSCDNLTVLPSQTFTSGVPVAFDRGLSVVFTDAGGTVLLPADIGKLWAIGIFSQPVGVTSPSYIQEIYGRNQKFHSGNVGFVDPHGPDGKAGVAGVDDDANGLTDEFPTIGRPGVDDNANGVTDEFNEVVLDELGERGFGDDADDEFGRGSQTFLLNTQVGVGSGIFINVDPGSGGGNLFSIRHFLGFGESSLEPSNELATGFYVPDVNYSFVWCVSNTCYGAQLWVGNDAANILETLGPLVNSDHNTAGDNEVAIGASQFSSGVTAILERWPLVTNALYDNKFWAIENPSVNSPVVTVDQDRDRDGDVDGIDFTVFASCFNKSGNPPRTIGCTAADAAAMDVDNDGDVDGIDFTVFASCFNKSGNTPRATGCYPDTAVLTACGS